MRIATIFERDMLTGVSREYMRAALMAVRREYGSTADGLRSRLNMTDEEIAVLRERYLE